MSAVSRRALLLGIPVSHVLVARVSQACAFSGKPDQNEGQKTTSFRTLGQKYGQLVADIADVIIPSDGGPGATDAGVANYVDSLLATDLNYYRSEFETNLRCFERACRAQYRKGFTELQEDQKEQFLRAVEAGDMEGEWRPLSSPEFFRFLRMLVFEGYLCDPRHEGNRKGVGWKVMDYRP